METLNIIMGIVVNAIILGIMYYFLVKKEYYSRCLHVGIGIQEALKMP